MRGVVEIHVVTPPDGGEKEKRRSRHAAGKWHVGESLRKCCDRTKCQGTLGGE